MKDKKDFPMTVYLPLSALTAAQIAACIKRAEAAGDKKINFVFGDMTKVKFTVKL